MNLYRAAELLGVPERRITDLSLPVNPLGPSRKVKAELRRHLKHLGREPDPLCRRMRRHIARAIQVEEESVVCGRRVDLLHAILRSVGGSGIVIPLPADPLYERVAATAVTERGRGSMVFHVCREADGYRISVDALAERMDEAGVVILPNPHNVTGTVMPREKLAWLIAAAEDRGCRLVVDEQFIEFVPSESLASMVQNHPSLIVLRSLGPFHALTGLGADFGIMEKGLARTVGARLVAANTLAQRAAVTVLRDRAFRRETAELMKKEKAFLEGELGKLGMEFIPSDVNFYLLRAADADALCKYLLARYILVDVCRGVRGIEGRYVRIAVRSHRENALFIRALRGFRGEVAGERDMVS